MDFLFRNRLPLAFFLMLYKSIMQSFSFIKSKLLLIFLALFLVESLLVHPANALEIIANKSIDEKHLNQQKLWAVFHGRSRFWPNGIPTKVYMLSPDSSLHYSFCQGMLNSFPMELQRSWNRLIYSGMTEGPVYVETEQEMIEAIKTQSGAVGYVEKAEKYDIEGIYVIDIK